MLLLLISFIAGFLTVLAPCVLPLLPVIIGGSISSGVKQKSRPYIIATSLAVAVIAFTLILKVSTSLADISPNTLNYFSGGLVTALGLVSIFPELWERTMVDLNWEAASQRFLGRGQKNKGKYLGPILIGIALGPVFSSCSPTYAFILASVLPRNFFGGLIYLITYALALVIALLLVALLGRKYVTRFPWAINTHSLFRRAIGVLFVLIGIAIIAGWQVKIEIWVANHLPFDETRLEQSLLSSNHKSIAPKLTASSPQNVADSDVFNVQPTPAPEFAGLTNWINSEPLTMSSLKGKVILVDFWTYSCVNCNRALPYVQKWYSTYQKDGLVVVGVHTPEFAFEHNPTNVQNFVKSAHITYPVALDNSYQTWDVFDNDSWPADYLIDKNGEIRYVAYGEGDYDVTERAIQALLGVNALLQTPASNVPITQSQTPETYFGTDREANFSGTPQLNDGSFSFGSTPINKLAGNNWTLGNKWQIAAQSITSQSSGSTLSFNVSAKDVYLVAGSADNMPKSVSVSIDSNNQFGPDDPGGNLTVSGSKLYHIAAFDKFTNAVITLKVPAGVSLYTFTFGS